ncbi:M48 family metallopeptidase [Cohnella algarum]|uniref:M48 family metallopeptidase n=1 Tax=Cohnella algarum TaxID=2044859 RepID=UPI001966F85C|nr:M48 family metallopeptidase [Cohnella algarum]MBN2984561.1 M48 family metallopeptidase [Cohnella algarum]
MRTKALIRAGVIAVAVYALAMAVYVWHTSPNEVPEAYRGTAADPGTFFTADQLRESAELNAARNWIFFMSGPWEWLIYFVLLMGGAVRGWKDKLDRTRLPGWIRFPLFVLLVDAAAFLLYLPLRIFSFAVSKSYGISTQPVPDWIRDKLVEFGVGYVTMLAVTAVAFGFISRGGRWWLRLWLLSIPFTLFMMYVQPVVIDPLYNQFSRLSDAHLEGRILELAEHAGVPTDRVYEANMSEKTNAINAYVNGIGSSLRIVLWDTMLTKLDEDEILIIVAHEIGHYIMHHLEWSAVGAVGSSLVLLWLGSRLYEWIVRRWGNALGIRKPGDIAALPLVLLLLSSLSFVSLPVTNLVSRQAEAAADRYAYELIGSSEGAVTMHHKMAIASLSDIDPPLLVKWFRSSHPSDLERIVEAERFASAADA